MTGADLLPATVLRRKAVVYVRQSTQAQVQTNLESKRRQYELVDVARRRGFRDVEVIDDDLGRSASGSVARPGFERLVAWLCAGEVGAVLCFDASRLSRNGRDWHHLLDLCGLVEARVIDLDGVYDPCRPNDRLLLGMKGSMSEFELGVDSVLRARMLDAARAKARRGELRISVPIGYVWHRELGLGFDPDLRMQEVVRLIFTRFRDLGSARQVLLSMRIEQFHFPRPSDGKKLVTFDWTPIRYRNVISVLKNPFYAGAYAYGKGEKRTEIVDGRTRRSYRHRKPLETWEVLLKDHLDGASRQLAAPSAWNPCLPFRREERRMADDVGSRRNAGRHALTVSATSSRPVSCLPSRWSQARPTRSGHPTCTMSASSPRSWEQVARVGPIPRTNFPCFQTLEEGGTMNASSLCRAAPARLGCCRSPGGRRRGSGSARCRGPVHSGWRQPCPSGPAAWPGSHASTRPGPRGRAGSWPDGSRGAGPAAAR